MKFVLALVLAMAGIGTTSVWAQRFQQDSWYLETTVSMYQVTGISSGSLKCLTAGPTGTYFIAHQSGTTWRLHIFNRDFQWLYAFPTSSSPHLVSLADIVVGTNSCVYAALAGGISVFDLAGNLLRQWSANSPVAVEYGPDGLIYVAEGSSRLIQVFEDTGRTGVLVRSFAGAGTLPSQFDQDLSYLLVTRVGEVHVSPDSSSKIYSLAGDYLRNGPVNGGVYLELRDGLIRKGTAVFPADSGTSIATPFPDAWHGVDFEDGRMVSVKYSGQTSLQVWRRAYLEPGANHPPIPEIVSAAQRAGTTLLDIDYRVWDDDSSNVAAAIIAVNTGTNLVGNLIPMRAFVEGTGTNLGWGRIPGVTYRVTWNASSDWTTNYGRLKFHVLARDEDAGFENMYLTLPASGTNPALTVARNPLRESELVNAFTWLVATNDPAVAYSNRAIYGVGGAYSGVRLVASNNVVSTQGVSYLLGRYNLRLATTQEYRRVASGNAGVTNRWTSNLMLQPDAQPQQVNEFGFNAGPQSGASIGYVVPLP